MALRDKIENALFPLILLQAIKVEGSVFTVNFQRHDQSPKGSLTLDHHSLIGEAMAESVHVEPPLFSAIAGLPGASEEIAYRFAQFAQGSLPIPLIHLEEVVRGDERCHIRAREEDAVPQGAVLLVGDYARSGTNLCEGARALSALGLEVTDALVFLDFEQEARAALFTQGIHLRSVVTKHDVL